MRVLSVEIKHNKTVALDRRGRAVLSVFGISKFIAFNQFSGSPCAK